MMKKLIIGRNNACDIVIPDTSDLVSRKQAVLTISFWGKMVIYDTSNNGTFINGKLLENGKGSRVTRADKVNFARVADLNWDEVKDPYKKVKIHSLVVSVAVIALAVLAILFIPMFSNQTEDIVNTGSQTIKGGSVTTVKPIAVDDKPTVKTPNTRLKKKPKPGKEGVDPKDLVEKEVDDNSPIYY
ncbi:MAG: FHA domain-containing protein [Muribaculaceae bacterium]